MRRSKVKIKIKADQVTLDIEVNKEDPTLCNEDCFHFWTEPRKDSIYWKALCVFGRLRWKDEHNAYRHKNCLAGKKVRKRTTKRQITENFQGSFKILFLYNLSDIK